MSMMQIVAPREPRCLGGGGVRAGPRERGAVGRRAARAGARRGARARAHALRDAVANALRAARDDDDLVLERRHFFVAMMNVMVFGRLWSSLVLWCLCMFCYVLVMVQTRVCYFLLLD
jgi:hypothetical protein